MPDRTQSRPESVGPTPEPFAEALAEWIEQRRRNHDALGHTPTSVLGYCAEDDGISATWCAEGIWLRAVNHQPVAPDVELRKVAQRWHDAHRQGRLAGSSCACNRGDGSVCELAVALAKDPSDG